MTASPFGASVGGLRGAPGLTAPEQGAMATPPIGDGTIEGYSEALAAPATAAAAAANAAAAAANDVVADQAENIAIIEAAQAATAADVGLTHADVEQTAADRAQTGLDRQQTGADVLSAGQALTNAAAQAGNSAASASASETARQAAYQQQLLAAASANAAGMSATQAGDYLAAVQALALPPYPNTAAGIAATTNGQYFLVISAGPAYADLYQNISGSAVSTGKSLASYADVNAALTTANAVAVGLAAEVTRATDRAERSESSYPPSVFSPLDGATVYDRNGIQREYIDGNGYLSELLQRSPLFGGNDSPTSSSGEPAFGIDPATAILHALIHDVNAPVFGAMGAPLSPAGASLFLVYPATGAVKALIEDVNTPVFGGGGQMLGDNGRSVSLVDHGTGVVTMVLAGLNETLLKTGIGVISDNGRQAATRDPVTGTAWDIIRDVNEPLFGAMGLPRSGTGHPLIAANPVTGVMHARIEGVNDLLFGVGVGSMNDSGHQALVLAPDGTMILPDCTVNRNAPFLPIQTVDGEYGYGLAVIDTNGRKVAIDFDSGRNIPLLIDGFSAMTATYLNRQGATTATKSVSLAPSTTISSSVDTLHVFAALGQSKGLIGNAISATHTTALFPGRALMLGPAPATWEGHADGNSTPPLDSFFVGVNDLVEVANAGGNLGETPWTAIATTLLPTYPANEGIAVATFSVSGQSYAPDTSTGTTYYGLRRGTDAWEMARRGMLSMALNARLAGRKLIFEGFFLGHGQTDSTIGTTQAQYLAYLLEWQRDAAALARATFGPDADTRFYMIVANDIGGTNAGPYRAMIQTAQLYPDRFVIVAADYQFARIDGTHYTILAQDELGELLANARITLKAGGVPTTMIRKAVRTGATIKLGFDVPAGPIAIDTVTIADPGHAGFAYVQTAGTAQTISTVAVTGAREITITLAGDPGTPSYEEITYALPAAGGHGSGCVRDSATAVSTFDNTFHLYNWAPPQWLPVENF